MAKVQTDCVFFEIKSQDSFIPIGIMMLSKEEGNDRTEFHVPDSAPAKWVSDLAMVLGHRIAQVNFGVIDPSLRKPIAFHAMWSDFARQHGLTATHTVFDGPIDRLKEFDFRQLRLRAWQAEMKAPEQPASLKNMPPVQGEVGL